MPKGRGSNKRRAKYQKDKPAPENAYAKLYGLYARAHKLFLERKAEQHASE